MRLVSLLFVLLCTVSCSQDIDFDYFKNLKRSKPNEIEKQLKNRGWYLFSDLPATKNSVGIMAFVPNSEKSNRDCRIDESYIEYEFTKTSQVTKLRLITKYESFFNSAVKYVGENNLKIKPSKINGRLFFGSYIVNDDIIELEITQNRISKATYYITIKNLKS